MIITGLLLFLIGTNLSYAYPSSIRYENPCSPSIEDVNRVFQKDERGASKMPCHAMSAPNNKVTKELRHPCGAQHIEDPVVTVEDTPCTHESEELQTYIPAEIPSAPVLPPLKLSESPIVVEDVELPEYEEISQPSQRTVPCSPEITNEEEENSIIPTNLPTPPELPPLVTFNVEEDCENNDEVSVLPSREPSQVLKLPSQSYEIDEENSPCSAETPEDDEKETPILPNIPTPPELPPLVSFNEEEDCENNDDVSPSREPTQTLKLPSESHDIEEENIPCETESSEDYEKDTSSLQNIPTPPELPPLASFSEKEKCENNEDVSTLPSREPNQALKLPSQSHEIDEENSPCSAETSEDDEKETPILTNIPTPPELPPLVSFNEEDDCENNDDVSTLPSREPTQALKLPSQSHEIDEENSPCSAETSEDDEKETPILTNIPTPPELPPLVSFNEEDDCENNDDVSTLPSREPTQALKLPSQSHEIDEENSPCSAETPEDDEKETPTLSNIPTPPELPPLVSFNEEEDCENDDEVSVLPSREPSQALKLPSQSHEENIPCPTETSTDEEKEIPTVCDSFDEEEECDTPDEEVKNNVIIPAAPEIPIIALPKLPLDIELPEKEETKLKVPKPNVCVRNIVADRIVPNIICRKTNSASKANLIPNPACKNAQ